MSAILRTVTAHKLTMADPFFKRYSCIVVSLLVGTFGLTAPAAIAASTSPNESRYQAALQAAKEQLLLIMEVTNLQTKSRSLAGFYNNLEPHGFCFSFVLDGEWEFRSKVEGGSADDPQLVTDANKSSLRYSVISKKELAAVVGRDDYEKATAILMIVHQPLRELVPASDLEASTRWLGGTGKPVLVWRLNKDSFSMPDGNTLKVASHFLFPSIDGQMINVMVTSSNREREDELAGQFVRAFKMTTDPECFLPTVREMLLKYGSKVF